MASKNTIIEELYNSKNFNDCINKMEPDYLRDDLKAEVILVVCEMNDERLAEMYDTKKLIYFVVRIIMNMIKSKTSGFYRKYRLAKIEIDSFYDNAN